jgi:hypothetical protein
MVVDTTEKIDTEETGRRNNQKWHYVTAMTEGEANALKSDILSFAHRVLTDPGSATEGERAVLPQLIAQVTRVSVL